MNYIDIIFFIIILYCIITGLRNGLVKSIGGIIAIIVGFYGASIFYSQLSGWLQGISSTVFTPIVANIFAFLALFLLFNRLFMIIVFIVDKAVSLPIIGLLNKLLGAIFGFLAGLLIVGVLILAIGSFYGGDISAFETSKIVPGGKKVIEFAKPFIPKSFNLSFLENDWVSNLRSVINTLPGNIQNVDDLVNYLKEDTDVPDKVIDNIKETQFNGVTSIDIDEIKNKLENYISNK
ncbi:MAG TPA: CvpA family protein [bacterium]|jgi:membrane protein required for colicin V production|nr:CvpA family protein [bacterium]HOG38346.1 CvpA family protein [bacterium]HQI03248.1 CvpA family protein [bacterium]